jgi:23S rRNA (cytosine1962-C5)-methyltransferase
MTMTKPHKDHSATKQKAPQAKQPAAPSLSSSVVAAAGSRDGRAKRDAKEGRGGRRREAIPEKGRQRAPVLTEPGARINRRAADRLRGGHLWVYASDVESLEVGEGDAPALLPVADSRGLLLGTALYSPTSQIALRMVAREAIGEAEWLGLLDSRLRTAIARRRPMLDAETSACRLCFSEADELPGLVADKYGEIVILQRLVKGLLSPAVWEACARVLREEVKPASILERPDPRMRELEGLPALELNAAGVGEGVAPVTRTQFRLNGLVFEFDGNAGQKTGAFLDQRANYAAAQEWARRLGATERALDVCCYQGGFALHLARVCKSVTGIDASHASLEVAERNLEANRAVLRADVEWVEGDAFQILRDWSEGGEKFNTIVLDPPAFAKTKRAVEGALRGYKELNLRALKMLRPGGLLVTCSCSHHVGWADLEGAVAAAAADAHRRVRLLERRGAALDHPVVLNLPETEYLKCLVLEVE